MNSRYSVLLVDDCPVTLNLLRSECEALGMRVFATQSAEQASSIALSGEFQLVIADWDIPGMLGIELCTAVRHCKFGTYTYFILLSERDGAQYLQTALDAEVDQFLSKPLNLPDLKTVLSQATRFLDLQVNHDLLEIQLPTARQHVEFDMTVLRHVQTEMMPKHLEKIGHSTVNVYNKPYSILSGDQCGAFEIDENTIGFFLVDVVGHGFHAAVQALSISSLFLKNYRDGIIYKEQHLPGKAPELRRCGEVLSLLNSLHQMPDNEAIHICAVYGMFNRHTRELEVSLAGMPQPYLLRDSGALIKLGESDLPLGLFPDIEYESAIVFAEPGDQFLAMSDGLSEVRGRNGEIWGTEGVESAIRESGIRSISPLGRHLLSRAKKWAGTEWDQVFSDDLTLLGLDLDSSHDSQVKAEAEIHVLLQSTPEFSSSQLRLPTSEPAALIPQTRALPQGKSGRVLLVFDELAWALRLRAQLEAQSLEVIHCSPQHLQRYKPSTLGQLDLILVEHLQDSGAGESTRFPIEAFVLQRKPLLFLCHAEEEQLTAEAMSEFQADELLRLPVSDVELRFKVKTALRHARIQDLIRQKASQLESLREEIRRDMGLVARQQAGSLPTTLNGIPGFKADWLYKPAYMVSGDFLGLFRVSDREVGFFSLDARGQGVLALVQGWLIFRMLTGVYQANASPGIKQPSGLDCPDSSPAAKLEALNRTLLALNYSQKVECSVCYGLMEVDTGRVRICNAGHPPAVLSQADGQFELIYATAPRLGVDPKSQFNEVEFYLGEGQRLHVFSDGLYQTLYPRLDKLEGCQKLGEIFAMFIEDEPALMRSMLERSVCNAKPDRVRDVSMLTLELNEVLPERAQSMTVQEWFDNYQASMPVQNLLQGLSAIN